MSIFRLLLLSALLGFVALPLPAVAGGPVPFVSPEGRFIAHFPETPHPERSGRSTWAGRIEEGSYQIEEAGLYLRVEYHDVPRVGLLVLSREAILGMARDSMLKDVGAIDARTEPVSLRGHPGLALRYATKERPDRTEEARLFLVGSRLYVAFARADAPGTGEETAAHFLASFDAWEPGETVASATAIGTYPGL